jgi:alpha-L-rhamnosidase
MSAKGSLETPYGRIESHWRIDAGRFLLDVTVPPNATATVYLPGSSVKDATESGKALAMAEGVSNVRAESGEIVCRVTAGEYRFATKA